MISMSDSTTASDSEPIRLTFMCVQNAGRSQMATAFAERERAERGLEDDIEIRTGGTHPADHVHQVVIEVMQEEGFDLSNRTPREITTEELTTCDYVATMGCSTLDISGAETTVDVRDWDLTDPDGQDKDTVQEIRSDIERRVQTLFDEIGGQPR